MNQSRKDDRKSQAKDLAKKIQGKIRDIFNHHNRKVERLNHDNKFGGPLNKNDKSEKIYADLSEILGELKILEKKVHECDKLRRERRELYQIKLKAFVDAVNDLVKRKNIKTKINQHLEDLIKRTIRIIDEAHKNLKSYEKQSGSICGKAYDFKPSVERSMLELSQLGFLWQSVSKFDSVTNDSVKEIYLPLEYDENDFQLVEGQIINLWPEPKEVVKVVNQKVQQIVEYKSQLQLAHEMLFGFTKSQDVASAIQIYEKQANKASPDVSALNALGTLYEEGKYVGRDLKKSFNFFMKSAKMGDSEGLYKIGKFLEKGWLNAKQYFEGLYSNREGEVRGAIQYYEKAAAKGHLDAMTDLGFVYQKGIMKEDLSEYYIQPLVKHALSYYLKAKQKKFPRAYNNLGSLLISSRELQEGVENCNLQKGIKYLQKAVQLKYPKAYVNLGKCYLNGVGVASNINKARALFLQGGELGDIQSKLQYIKSYLGCSLDDDKTMMKLVDITRQVLLVDKNNAEASYLMGLFEQKAIGTGGNKQSAFYYISQSARQDYAPAITKLGDYYYSGFYVDKNFEWAQNLYEKAAQKKDSQAILNLGVMIEKKVGNINGTEPQEFYRKAAGMGNTNAMLLLGLKENGINIENNEDVKKAAERGNVQALKMLSQTSAKWMNNTNKSKTGYNQVLRKMANNYVRDINQ